jgi:hypothetical protein
LARPTQHEAKGGGDDGDGDHDDDDTDADDDTEDGGHHGRGDSC